jgi:exonuclease SbcC
VKPLRLSMQAFGPYAAQSEIDFRSLSRGGLFLIHGQTGAGKTSILDGICFALFGTSSGNDRSSEGLRSDLAASTLPTEVVFELMLGTETYRVLRRPKQMLKKVRGEGLAVQQPKGELWKLGAADWELVTSGDKKTDERIAELIGMTEEQFRQVVVLPQGQFRKFLSASSDAREKLLETLFRTEKYRKLAEHLADQASLLAEEIGAQKQNLAAQLSSLEIGAADELEARFNEAVEQVKALDGSSTGLEERLAAAAERLRAAQRRAQAASELGALINRESTLNENAAEIHQLSEKLERDRRSRPVLTVDASILQHERDLARISGSRASEQRLLSISESNLSDATKSRDALERRLPEIDALKAEQQSLREIYASAKRLKTEQDGLTALEAAAETAASGLRSLEQKLSTARDSRISLGEKIQALEARASKLETARVQRRHEQTQLDTLLEELREVEQGTYQVEHAEAFHRESKEAWEAARTVVTKLKIEFHLSQASRLSAELEDGAPCPVCGSIDHPRLAGKTGAAPSSAEQVSTEPEVLEDAELALERASMRHASAQERAKSASETLSKSTARLEKRFGLEPGLSDRARQSIENSERALAELDRVVLDSESAHAESRACKTKLATLEVQTLQLESDVRLATSKRDESILRVETTKARVLELLTQVPPERRDLALITARGQLLTVQTDTFAKELSTAIDLYQETLQATTAARANIETLGKEIEQKTKELRTQTNERDALLASSGFATLDECRAAGLSAPQARMFEEKRRAYDDERAIVLSRLAELRAELAAFAPWAEDLETRRNEHRVADLERTENHGRTLALKERILLLETARTRIGKLTKALTALEEKYKVVGRLGAVAAGQPPHNLSRVNFARFVLASRLDDVLELASRRLYSMSRGQFTLKRALLGADKRKNAGLDLEVEDAHSGSTRPTSSLSGGEGFMASLSLALGLADVVQNELGGVRLDAVFVDEGFGTLDSEALELAMKTLAELQAGGRIVGVISHVPELKDQIARRLLVRKTPEGSQVGWESNLN